jgi:hypothetical protein
MGCSIGEDEGDVVCRTKGGGDNDDKDTLGDRDACDLGDDISSKIILSLKHRVNGIDIIYNVL